jgi:hypothetical protein
MITSGKSDELLDALKESGCVVWWYNLHLLLMSKIAFSDATNFPLVSNSTSQKQ